MPASKQQEASRANRHEKSLRPRRAIKQRGAHPDKNWRWRPTAPAAKSCQETHHTKVMCAEGEFADTGQAYLDGAEARKANRATKRLHIVKSLRPVEKQTKPCRKSTRAKECAVRIDLKQGRERQAVP